jgi:hypothetical protein
VLTSAGYWWGFALGQLVSGLVDVVVTGAAVVSLLVFFYTASEVAAEGTDLHPLDFWHGVPGRSKATADENWRANTDLLRPSWWTRVVAATGWPRALVWLFLAVSLACPLLSLAL